MRTHSSTPCIKNLFLGNKHVRDMGTPDDLEQFVKLLKVTLTKNYIEFIVN